MPPLPELVLSPQSWAIAVAFGLLGAVVGRYGGRLVRLFGPVHESTTPEDPERAGSEHAASPSSDDAMPQGADPEGAPRDREVAPETDEAPPPPRCSRCLTALPFPAWALVVITRRGLCPHCAERSPTHAGAIATTAVLFALVGVVLHTEPLPDLLAVLWLVVVGVSLATVDLRATRLPNILVGLAYIGAVPLVALATFRPSAEPHLDRAVATLISVVLVAVLYWLLWRVHPGGLGYGDVKLSGVTGLYAGWAAGVPGTLAASFWAFGVFSLIGLVLLALRRISRRQPFPLGPFMLGATFVTVLAGEPLLPRP